jgi:hypothetical protein
MPPPSLTALAFAQNHAHALPPTRRNSSKLATLEVGEILVKVSQIYFQFIGN